MVKIFIPTGYPIKVESQGKYVVYGMEVTTSDGQVHTVPVSEFRYTGDSVHFAEQPSEELNLVCVKACIELLAMQYENGIVAGMNVCQQKIITDNGWDSCPSVELADLTEVEGGFELEVSEASYSVDSSLKGDASGLMSDAIDEAVAAEAAAEEV